MARRPVADWSSVLSSSDGCCGRSTRQPPACAACGLDLSAQAKYEQAELAEAREWWNAEYEKTPAREPQRFHILSGAIFPIYDKVMGSSGIRNTKVARAMLVDGQALVGLNLSPADVPNVKQRLGIGTPLAAASPAEILDLVVGGSLIELDNGWRLTMARISGDDVLELVLNGANTFTGPVVMSGYGRLEIGSIDVVANPNPLGMSSVDPSNLVLNGFLAYMGTGAGVTDRGVNGCSRNAPGARPGGMPTQPRPSNAPWRWRYAMPAIPRNLRQPSAAIRC